MEFFYISSSRFILTLVCSILFVLAWLLIQKQGIFQQRRRVVQRFILWGSGFAYVLFALIFLLGSHFLFTWVFYVMFTMSLLWLGFFVLRDFFAGLIFRSRYSVKKGDQIVINTHIKGAIDHMGWFDLHLEQKKGELMSLAYHQITSVTQHKINTLDMLQQQISLSLPKTQSQQNWERSISQAILILPGVSRKRKASVAFIQEHQEQFEFEVRLYLFDEQQNIKHDLDLLLERFKSQAIET